MIADDLGQKILGGAILEKLFRSPILAEYGLSPSIRITLVKAIAILFIAKRKNSVVFVSRNALKKPLEHGVHWDCPLSKFVFSPVSIAY